ASQPISVDYAPALQTSQAYAHLVHYVHPYQSQQAYPSTPPIVIQSQPLQQYAHAQSLARETMDSSRQRCSFIAAPETEILRRRLQSNPNHGCNDSNSSETHLGKSLPIYFGEGLDEDGRVPEIEESLYRLENHQLASIEPTEEINISITEEQRTLKIGTGLDPAQRARIIDFLIEYQEVFAWSYTNMPVEKKNGKVRVCIDYRDLNKASPKDNFPLPHIDVLVDNTAHHTQFSFMDGFSGYNQIQMAEEDKIKTTFITMWGTFCYKVMPFGLKNVRATYQRAMVTLFHDMMHKEIEVYVDDIIAKSKEGEDHLVNLKRLFDRLRKYKLRLNPAKCTFGVKSGKLLGFVVSEKGIEVDPDKIKAIMELPPPSIVHETDPLKYLLGSPSSMRNIAKWRCQLTEYDIEYVSRTSVKGPAIADHLAEFPIIDDTPINPDFPDEGILQMNDEEETPGWKMYFDGAVNSTGPGIGAVLISPEGRHFPVAAKIDFPCTNNIAEYETLKQWKTKDPKLVPYHEYLKELTENFEDISFTYTPHMKNQLADALVTLASMVSITKENLIEPLEFEIAQGPAHCDVIDAVDGKPWYADIKHLLQTGQFPAFADRHDRRTLRRIAANFFLSGETLYRRSFDATLLRNEDVNPEMSLSLTNACLPYAKDHSQNPRRSLQDNTPCIQWHYNQLANNETFCHNIDCSTDKLSEGGITMIPSTPHTTPQRLQLLSASIFIMQCIPRDFTFLHRGQSPSGQSRLLFCTGVSPLWVNPEYFSTRGQSPSGQSRLLFCTGSVPFGSIPNTFLHGVSPLRVNLDYFSAPGSVPFGSIRITFLHGVCPLRVNPYFKFCTRVSPLQVEPDP
ncbi:hypothetical protein CRG98_014852, partial [Punica granatum]